MSFFGNIFRALSRVERRVLWGALALVLIGAAGLTVFFIKNRTVIGPAYRGAYAEGAVGQPSYVNPVLSASDIDQGLSRLLFADLENLADSIETSADGRTVQVHLKQGLVWSNGESLTSDDVIFTLQSIQDPDSRSPLAGLFQGVTADRKSALQVDFRLENLALASIIPDLRPAPRHLYENIPPANWRLSDYNLRPVASGAYVFGSHDADPDGFITAYRLVANPRYASARPYIQRVSFLFFRDTDGLLAAFNNGQVQGFGAPNPDLLNQVQRPHALTRWPTPTVYAVFWNKTANPALEPIEVRWALNLAADREAVLAAIQGFGAPAMGPFPPALLPPLPPAEPDPAASATSTDPVKILESRGWKKGNDGIWTKSIARANVRLKFALTVPDIVFLKNAAQNLADQWRAFGAEVEIKLLPPDAALLDAITNRNYDGLLFGNTVRGTGDLYPFWHSSGRFAPGLNLAIYRNTRVDALLESLRTETDPVEREKDMRTVADLILDDEAAVFLFSADNLYVASNNVQGVEAGFIQNPADRLEQLSRWYVETARKLK